MNEIKSKIVGWKVAANDSVEAEVEKIINASDEEILANASNFEQEVAHVKKVIERAVAKATLKRPLYLEGKSWRLKPPHSEHALYVHLSAIEHSGKKYPFEIFFNSKDPQHIEWTNALTLTISEAFRNAIVNGTSLGNLIGNLKETVSLSGGYVSKVPEKPKFVNGLVAEIAYVVEAFSAECHKYNKKAGNDSYWETVTFSESYREELLRSKQQTLQEYVASLSKHSCPECGSELAKVAGCDTCTCGYNKCG